MKLLFAFILLSLVASCGKTPEGVSGAGSVGQSRSFVSAPATTTQQNIVSTLCTKLMQKENNLQFYVNGFSKFNYDTTYTACDDSVTTGSAAPTLTNNGGVLQYYLAPGQSLVTSIETSKSGLISQLCQAGANLGYPLETSSSVAIWYSVYSDGDCPRTDPDYQCVRLETGVKQVNGQYIINRNDQFVLDFSPGQQSGMVVRHERAEQGNCANNKTVLRTSVFKGIN